MLFYIYIGRVDCTMPPLSLSLSDFHSVISAGDKRSPLLAVVRWSAIGEKQQCVGDWCRVCHLITTDYQGSTATVLPQLPQFLSTDRNGSMPT